MKKETSLFQKISLGGVVIFCALFLSGCIYKDSQQQAVLRSADEYKVKSAEERQPEDPDAVKRLSVSAPGEKSVQQSQQAQESQAPQEPQNKSASNSKQPPTMKIDQNKTYSAVLKTGEGDITIDLDVKKTPITANNFVSLSRDGFYSGTIFHRVIKDFMIQGGDPNGDGSGGPGYKFDDENLEGKYTRGTVAMANSGPNTNGSQFFIMHKDYDLPNNYVILGHVSNGMDVVDKIATAEVTVSSSMENSKPVSPVKIDSVEIVEK
jgi:cyclophilin family peptidyl-prolyl cis-trans isomerase